MTHTHRVPLSLMNPTRTRKSLKQLRLALALLWLIVPSAVSGEEVPGDPEVMCECCYCPYEWDVSIEHVSTTTCTPWLTCHVFYQTFEVDLSPCTCSSGPCPDLSGQLVMREGWSFPGSKWWRYSGLVACENGCELAGYDPAYCGEIENFCEQMALNDAFNLYGATFWTGAAITCGGCP